MFKITKDELKKVIDNSNITNTIKVSCYKAINTLILIDSIDDEEETRFLRKNEFYMTNCNTRSKDELLESMLYLISKVCNDNLDHENCLNLTSLPENLYVGGFLNLSDCTSLTTLPENLYVDNDDIHALKNVLDRSYNILIKTLETPYDIVKILDNDE